MDHVNESMFPQNVYSDQLKWIHRFLLKPREVKTRDYVNRAVEINAYLTEFPRKNNEQARKLEDEDLMDILEFSLPKHWRTTMTLQGFSKSRKSKAELIEFCERLEMAEPEVRMVDYRIPKKRQLSVSEKKQAVTKRKRDEEKAGDQDCILHGDGCGHSSHGCRTLRRMAKKNKDDLNKKRPKKQQDLQAIIAESFTMAMQGMKKKTTKKKIEKPKEEFDLYAFENLQMSDSEEEDGELVKHTEESSNA